MITLHFRRGNSTFPLFASSTLTALLLCLLLLAGIVWLMGVLLSLASLVAPLLLSLGWSTCKLFGGIFLLYRCTVWIRRFLLSWLQVHWKVRSFLLALLRMSKDTCFKLLHLVARVLLQ